VNEGDFLEVSSDELQGDLKEDPDDHQQPSDDERDDHDENQMG